MKNQLANQIYRALGRLRVEDSGQTMVLCAMMLPILLGAVGMAVDVGYVFDHRRQMQGAADSAVLAGGRAVRMNPSISTTDLTTIVHADATRNGFVHGTKNVTVAVCRPAVDSPCPTQYGYTADNEAVKVTIDQPKATFFSGILGLTSMNVGVTAVASSHPSTGSGANVIVLDDTCTSGAFHASGGTPVVISGRVWVNSCDQHAAVAAGGTPVTVPGGTYIACDRGICGGYHEQGGAVFTPTPFTGEGQIRDPLEDLLEPVPFGTTYNDPNVMSGTRTLQPGIYDKGITLKGGTVTFAPGIYFLDGQPLTIKGGATVLGDGVMFFAYNDASLIIQDGTTQVNMSAPSSGYYRGMFWFQARNNEKDAVITAGPLVHVNGIFYVSHPDSEMSFSGNSDSGLMTDYTVFVVWHFAIAGGATFNSDFTKIGGNPLKGPLVLSE